VKQWKTYKIQKEKHRNLQIPSFINTAEGATANFSAPFPSLRGLWHWLEKAVERRSVPR